LSAIGDRAGAGARAMPVSVVVTTYNRPDALGAVLAALAEQDEGDFEVVVADDGSTSATAEAIASIARAAPRARWSRLVHAWQPDAGFRAAAARNVAVAASRGDYLVFLDGDCVPRPDFVSRHRRLAEPGWMVTGSRVLLSAGLTERALAGRDAVPLHRRGLGWWLGRRLARDANKVVPLIRVGDASLRHYRRVAWRRIKSCNLAVWRRDFVAVDGFDERFVGWGHEDADLVLRLARSGVRRKGGAFSTEVFHLWHPENPRALEQENRRRVEARVASGVVRAELGLSSHPGPEDRIAVVAGDGAGGA